VRKLFGFSTGVMAPNMDFADLLRSTYGVRAASYTQKILLDGES
jgi:hypothetical protein